MTDIFSSTVITMSCHRHSNSIMHFSPTGSRVFLHIPETRPGADVTQWPNALQWCHRQTALIFFFFLQDRPGFEAVNLFGFFCCCCILWLCPSFYSRKLLMYCTVTTSLINTGPFFNVHCDTFFLINVLWCLWLWGNFGNDWDYWCKVPFTHFKYFFACILSK